MFSGHWDAYGIGAPDARGERSAPAPHDDGLGIAGVLEIARAFKAGPRPERTLLFAAWTAEERGLLGSEYDAANPLYPAETMVANITLDTLQSAGPARDVFPLSNWTELDVWQYIAEEELEVPSIYYAHDRQVFKRDGMLYALSPFVELIDGEEPFGASVRYRTVGDMSCTGAVASTAVTLDAVVAEIAATRITERGETRADDRVSEAAMEDRKRGGYF